MEGLGWKVEGGDTGPLNRESFVSVAGLSLMFFTIVFLFVSLRIKIKRKRESAWFVLNFLLLSVLFFEIVSK